MKGEQTLSQISSKYGVHVTQINRWKKEAIALLQAGFSNKVKTADQNQNELIRQLYEQIGQLTGERDWLKKKSDQFGFSL